MATEPIFSHDTVVFVTGASSGLGAAVARHLGGRGCRVGLMARRPAELAAVAAAVEQAGGQALGVPGDVTVPAEVRAAIDRVRGAFGPIDAAFLNAGVGDFMTVEKFDAAQVRHLFEVNVFGVAYCLEALLPEMLERRRGVLIATSSLARYRGLPMASAYAATKAAVSVMLEGLRIEAATHGVRVVTFEPGFIKTDLTARNKFKMPFLMDADVAAGRLCDAVDAGKRVIRFPWPLAAVGRLGTALPPALGDLVAAKLSGYRPRRR